MRSSSPIDNVSAQWFTETRLQGTGRIGLSLRNHPVSFLRADLARRRIVTCAEAMSARDRSWLETAGIVLVRQRPGSAKGVMFITLEDETGIANLVVPPALFERHRRALLSSTFLFVEGVLERAGRVVNVKVDSAASLTLGMGPQAHPQAE